MLHSAAAAAASQQSHLPGTLYVVATPIGNLADISLRAVYLLGRVDAVACEDTRVAAQLLRHLGLHKPLLAVHAHNEHSAAQAVLQRLAVGESVAYVSDAGTPAVSDPGALLVAAAARAGHPVVPLPGPSSATAAISVAGDAQAGGYCFIGFLPAKGGERSTALAAMLSDRRAQIVFEAPHRVVALASELALAAPERRVTLCRELSKQFETVITQTAATLPAWLAQDPNRQRGEFVLVLHGLPLPLSERSVLSESSLHTLRVLLRELPLKQACALAAEITGAPRKHLYQRALAERGAEPSEGEAGAEPDADQEQVADPVPDEDGART